MSVPTIVIGGSLVGVGLAGYFGSHRASATALIPAIVGVPLAALGLVAARSSGRTRRIAIIAAAAVGAIGLAGAVPGVAKLPKLARGEAERPAAVVAQSVMAALCAGGTLSAAAALARG